MRKVILLVTFFLTAPTLLIFCVLLLSYSSFQKTNKYVLGATDSTVSYAALPQKSDSVTGQAESVDRRITSLQDFFSYYHSPLLEFAPLIVQKADEYDIDYRLLPAIAMQETTLCKKTLSRAPYNCWGFGIYGKKITSFDNYNEAIDTISRYFATKKSNGLDSLEEIANIYNPTNHNNWKENVTLTMSHL